MSTVITRQQLRDAIEAGIKRAWVDGEDFTAEAEAHLREVAETSEVVARTCYALPLPDGVVVCCPVGQAFRNWADFGWQWDAFFASGFDHATRDIAKFEKVLLIRDERGA